ncbi:MAG: copper chaperone PCu(A)C, partial [Pseudomonadota bacterium]|nr:copper chaperone PCu(A)C [Pseudomonadota bacterium]
LLTCGIASAGASMTNADRQIGALVLRHAFARATAPGQTATAVYLDIVNQGKREDRLLRVSSPVAAAAEIHSMTMTDGVMRMRELDQITLPAGKAVSLMPSQGYHLMLQRLRQPLVAGQQISLRLRFAHAGTVVLQVPVAAIGAMGPEGATAASPAPAAMPAARH